MLPPNIPHNPVRFADTVGVVVELPRPEITSIFPSASASSSSSSSAPDSSGEVEGVDLRDGLRWYCSNAECREVVAEKRFVMRDLGTQIKETVQAFERDKEGRTCRRCGTVCEMVPNGGDVEGLRRG